MDVWIYRLRVGVPAASFPLAVPSNFKFSQGQICLSGPVSEFSIECVLY